MYSSSANPNVRCTEPVAARMMPSRSTRLTTSPGGWDRASRRSRSVFTDASTPPARPVPVIGTIVGLIGHAGWRLGQGPTGFRLRSGCRFVHVEAAAEVGVVVRFALVLLVVLVGRV